MMISCNKISFVCSLTDDVENLKNRKLPQSKEGKCMMACILKKLNVINKDGKFEVATVKTWMADKYKGNTVKLTRAYARADNCAEQLPAIEDECEFAAKLLECTKKNKKLKS
uniref:Odorant-binding protein 12 n=1 Tax=Tropidothorax elegans TaxID=2233830 RepID=A0A2Z5EM69_9HEMI|nr:odorant-binding protein 12 [Tropidothorax elegans]